MIFCERLLFIHVPKTAGSAITEYLLAALPRPTYYTLPNAKPGLDDPQVVYIPGFAHEMLEEAGTIVAQFGFELDKFPMILAVVRNPYALEVSRYTFLQQGHSVSVGFNQALAFNEDFETFACTSENHAGDSRPIESFYQVNGHTPDNLRIVKFENLAEEFADAMRAIGLRGDIDLPKENVSSHDPYLAYYTPKAEEAVYSRYRWMFDQGLYERLRPEGLARRSESPTLGSPVPRHRIPIDGPARQTGPSSGLWSDLFVDRVLQFRARSDSALSRLQIAGQLPDEAPKGFELRVKIDGEDSVATFRGAGRFAFDISCSVGEGAAMDIEVEASHVFPRGDVSEGREVSFQLDTVSFAPALGPRDAKAKISSWEAASEVLLRYVSDGDDEDVAGLLAIVVYPHLQPPLYERSFRIWEEKGFHVTPVARRSPIPHTHELRDELWERESDLPGIDMNEETQLHLLRDEFPRFAREYADLPEEPETAERQSGSRNQFGGTDALVLYCMIRHFDPKLVLQVGSGFSTEIVRRAADKNRGTRLHVVDAYADEMVRKSLKGVSSLVRAKVEETSLGQFDELVENDVLFIDSSHVVKIGGDVNFLFLDVLPRLKPGVIVHVHDVFLPREYPRQLVMEQRQFWSEQYLLQAFLALNDEYEVLFANNFLAHSHWDEMRAVFPTAQYWGGSSFWIRRKHSRRGAEPSAPALA